MAHFLIYNEGLFCGSTAAINLVGCVKLAREMPKGSVIVTLLCDTGLRHLSKFFSHKFLEARNLLPKVTTDTNNLSFGSKFLASRNL